MVRSVTRQLVAPGSQRTSNAVNRVGPMEVTWRFSVRESVPNSILLLREHIVLILSQVILGKRFAFERNREV